MKITCDQGKVGYESERQAHRAALAAGHRKVRTYRCGTHWHYTRSVLATMKRSTPPKAHGPAPYVESAAKLRRKLENAAAQIRAAEKAFARVEQRKADAELRAAHILKQAEFETELELQHINELVEKIQWK